MIILLILFYVSFSNCQIFKYGNVSFQNTVIYEISNPKNIFLKLTSQTGDADLYVFNRSKFDKANINFSEYQFKSDSFGVDKIIIDIDQVPMSIVVLGAAQEDSKYILEISQDISKDLDYQALDDSVEKLPGSSYEDLFHQHSFDTNLYYAQDEKERLKLLSLNGYSEKDFKKSPKEKSPWSKKQKSEDRKMFNNLEEGSSLYQFLFTLLEVLLNLIL